MISFKGKLQTPFPPLSHQPLPPKTPHLTPPPPDPSTPSPPTAKTVVPHSPPPPKILPLQSTIKASRRRASFRSRFAPSTRHIIIGRRGGARIFLVISHRGDEDRGGRDEVHIFLSKVGFGLFFKKTIVCVLYVCIVCIFSWGGKFDMLWLLFLEI